MKEPKISPTVDDAEATDLATNSEPERTRCSDRKRAANRNNAQRSTGPRTSRGKLHSRANALKAGLFDKVVLTSARQLPDYPAFEQLQQDLLRAYPPQTLGEAVRLRLLGGDLWRVQHALALELNETARLGLFHLQGIMDRVTRYTGAMEKVKQRALATLADLDALAAAREDESVSDESEDGAEMDLALLQTCPVSDDPEIVTRETDDGAAPEGAVAAAVPARPPVADLLPADPKLNQEEVAG